MSDWEDYGGDDDYGDPGSTVVDWWDNGDGSFTNLADGTIWENDTQIGWELEDGTWMDLFGTIYDADNNPIAAAPSFDSTFEYDEASGFWFDTLTGAWMNSAGEILSYGGDAPRFPDSQSPNGDADQGGGFWSGVGDFLGKLFGGNGAPGGGSGGGGFGGGGSSGGGSQQNQAAQQRAQQAAQQLNQARQQGASAAQLAELQRRLTLAQGALNTGSGVSIAQTALIAGGVGLAVYALTRRNK